MNEDGDEFWCLTQSKRVTVGSYKGTPNVSLREYFEKNGKWLPTKKGITLSLDSWNEFKKIVDEVDAAIREK